MISPKKQRSPAAKSTHGKAAHASERMVPDPSLTYEFNELKKKLEQNEFDLKRKSKELSTNQLLMARIKKDLANAEGEIESLHERNEKLQDSIISLKLEINEPAAAKETEDLEKQIMFLKMDLEESRHKLDDTQRTVADLRLDKNRLQDQLDNAQDIACGLETSVSELKDEMENLKDKLKKSDDKVYSQNFRIAEMQTEQQGLQDESERLQSIIDSHEHADKMKDERIDLLVKETKQLKHMLSTRSEMSASLQKQLDDLLGQNLYMTQDEIDYYRGLDEEKALLQSKIDEAKQSLETYIDLLKESEDERKDLQDAMAGSTEAMDKLKAQVAAQKQIVEKENQAHNETKKTIIDLRREKAEFVLELRSNRDAESHVAQQLQSNKNSIATLARSRHEETEAKLEEQRRRKLAEESAKALRYRVNFLLQQLDMASQVSVSWQQQREFLKAEVASLHSANLMLREHLSWVVLRGLPSNTPPVIRAAISREVGDVSAAVNINTGARTHGPHAVDEGDTDYLELSDALQQIDAHGKALSSIHAHGNHEDLPKTSRYGTTKGALPRRIESLVERSLFDVMCAFTAGSREPSARTKSAKRRAKLSDRRYPAIFKASVNDEGIACIDVDTEESAVQYEELLFSLQVPAFLKFCQSKGPEKAGLLFTEKIAYLLDMYVAHTSDLEIQASEGRQEAGRLASQCVVADQRVKRMQARLSQERIGKQKCVLKYVRSLLKHSEAMRQIGDVANLTDERFEKEKGTHEDFRDMNDKSEPPLSQRGHNIFSEVSRTLDHVIGSHGVDTITGPLDDEMKESNGNTSKEERKLVVADLVDSAAVDIDIEVALARRRQGSGKFELLLPESQIDDETVHGMMHLLRGSYGNFKSGDRQSVRGPRGGINRYAYFDQIITLDLRGNLLTDLSSKLLIELVESSESLRLLNVRENCLSMAGIEVLFDAVRKNSSVLYVVTKQEGALIEGCREIAGSSKIGNETHSQATADCTRSVTAPRHALRVDARYNAAEPATIDDMLEAIERLPDRSKNAEGAVDDSAITFPKSKVSITGRGTKAANAGKRSIRAQSAGARRQSLPTMQTDTDVTSHSRLSRSPSPLMQAAKESNQRPTSASSMHGEGSDSYGARVSHRTKLRPITATGVTRPPRIPPQSSAAFSSLSRPASQGRPPSSGSERPDSENQDILSTRGTDKPMPASKEEITYSQQSMKNATAIYSGKMSTMVPLKKRSSARGDELYKSSPTRSLSFVSGMDTESMSVWAGYPGAGVADGLPMPHPELEKEVYAVMSSKEFSDFGRKPHISLKERLRGYTAAQREKTEAEFRGMKADQQTAQSRPAMVPSGSTKYMMDGYMPKDVSAKIGSYVDVATMRTQDMVSDVGLSNAASRLIKTVSSSNKRPKSANKSGRKRPKSANKSRKSSAPHEKDHAIASLFS